MLLSRLVTRSILKSLRGQAYSHYYLQYDETPLLVINTTEIDFVREPEDFDDLMTQIDLMESGRQVYVPRHDR